MAETVSCLGKGWMELWAREKLLNVESLMGSSKILAHRSVERDADDGSLFSQRSKESIKAAHVIF